MSMMRTIIDMDPWSGGIPSLLTSDISLRTWKVMWCSCIFPNPSRTLICPRRNSLLIQIMCDKWLQTILTAQSLLQD
uniref:Uncharacterized protein n=1 Tax=Arundo donax TaxID=35708 RepID=A0A0A9ERK3_ARUDO